MLTIFHRHRPWFIGALMLCYGAVVCWAAWRFLIAGCHVDEVAPLSYVSIALAGLLLPAALGRGALASIALFMLGGFAAEALSVRSGWPFGHYEYTGLGPQLAGVPLVIPIAWAILLVYISQMLAALKLPRLHYACCGALWLTLLDLAVEPLATGPLVWWRWLEHGPYYGVPLSNFAAWFGLSCILLALAPRIVRPNAWVRALGVSVPLFALLSGLSLGYPVVAALSALLLALHGAVVWRESRVAQPQLISER